jgi:hypothetical protein
MKRIVSFQSALPALALGAMLMLFGPTAALAQHGGGERGRSFSGGGGHRYSAPSYRGRSYSGGRYYGGGYYRGGGGFYPGRFYSGRGYYYGGRFWARPYYGTGVGIPFGWGYDRGYGCGYYDGYGYWRPAPCYVSPYPVY